MKRSLRLPFSLLVLVAILTLLSFRAAVRRGGSPDYTPLPDAPLNETLLRLAATDPVAAALQNDVDDLLDGNLPTARRHGSIPLWRRENYHEPRHHLELRSRYPTRYQIRFRAPRDYRFFPEFRRALRDWFRSRRFHPGVMSELLLQIKGNSDEDRRYASCAVVGNSGILLQHDHGALIDGHEMVIRLNNARIEGYHRNVGSKTALSFVNSNILHLCARRDGCFCHPYGKNVPILMYICQPVHFLDYIACNSSHKAPLSVTDPRLDILCARIVKYYSLKRFVEDTGKAPDEWSKAHDERAFHYSSGMQAIMVAVGICDRVSVFGFGKSTEAKHHYHTNQKAELSLHDYGAEYEFYRDLVERPQVIPFLGDLGFKIPSIVFYH